MCIRDSPKPYAQVRAEQPGAPELEGIFIQIEGEASTYRSSPSLFAVADPGDPTVVPYHHAETRLNSVGGHRLSLIHI